MKTYFTKIFKKHYLKRIYSNKNLDHQFEERHELFASNQRDPLLKDHALAGKMKGFRSFSITGDIRVVYYISNNVTYFVDVGSHNQVY